MNKLQAGLALAKVLAIVPGLLSKVLDAMGDSAVTADEAEGIALTALADEDVKILIKGMDVLDDKSEDMLVGLVARIVRNVVAAATGPKPAAA